MKLKDQLTRQSKLFDEQTKAKDIETVDVLQKYQSAVQKMHGRLKDIASKFDEGEKSRQARLRNSRKEMQHELSRIVKMNE